MDPEIQPMSTLKTIIWLKTQFFKNLRRYYKILFLWDIVTQTKELLFDWSFEDSNYNKFVAFISSQKREFIMNRATKFDRRKAFSYLSKT